VENFARSYVKPRRDSVEFPHLTHENPHFWSKRTKNVDVGISFRHSPAVDRGAEWQTVHVGARKLIDRSLSLRQGIRKGVYAMNIRHLLIAVVAMMSFGVVACGGGEAKTDEMPAETAAETTPAEEAPAETAPAEEAPAEDAE